jgi:hypothetical protein
MNFNGLRKRNTKKTFLFDICRFLRHFSIININSYTILTNSTSSPTKRGFTKVYKYPFFFNLLGGKCESVFFLTRWRKSEFFKIIRCSRTCKNKIHLPVMIINGSFFDLPR